MLKLRIIAVGRLKESYWRGALSEYLKRLKPYAWIEIDECQQESFNNPEAKINVLRKEAERIKKMLPRKSGYVISLYLEGKSYTSIEFSKKLSGWEQYGEEIIFIIGGPLGLDPEILSMSRDTLSLSKMTFTHQMARVILLEQVYRGIMLARGSKYHY